MSQGLLLDTHALIWWLADDRRLTDVAAELIADPAKQIFVSVASIWEIGIKTGTGKLRASDDLLEQIEQSRLEQLGIEPEDAWSVSNLTVHHRDPFDRMLIAQAMRRKLPIISGDPRFSEYAVEVRW